MLIKTMHPFRSPKLLAEEIEQTVLDNGFLCAHRCAQRRNINPKLLRLLVVTACWSYKSLRFLLSFLQGTE